MRCQFLNEHDQPCPFVPQFGLFMESDTGEVLHEFHCCPMHTQHLCDLTLDEETGICLFSVCPLPYGTTRS